MKTSNVVSHPRMGRLFALAYLLIIIPLLTFVLGKVSAESRDSAVNATTGGINAVVVKSWSDCLSTSVIWDSLNANWANYGTTPINIDYDNPDLCDGPVTFSNLVASGADVVILSDVAGGEEQYTSDEIAAVEAYAQQGHNVIGTYLLLQFEVTDNRGLAPIFGLSPSIVYTATDTPGLPTYLYVEPANPLFNNMAATYVSGGYPYYQVPLNDGTWDNDDLVDARYVAKTADNASVITLYDTPTYSAIYITNMPEYESGAIDEQFIYNAIVYNIQSRVYIPVALK